MKSASKPAMSNIVRSASSVPAKGNLRSSSGALKRAKNTTPAGQLTPQKIGRRSSSPGQLRHVISKSMEKTFLRLASKKSRVALVEAELVNGLSHQIRVLRQQRKWTQAKFASKLGTTQNVVSRLEDASYGRYSIKTLLEIGRTFDVALHVRYMPFSEFVPCIWNPAPISQGALPFKEDIKTVSFVDHSTLAYSPNGNGYLSGSETDINSVTGWILDAPFIPAKFSVYELDHQPKKANNEMLVNSDNHPMSLGRVNLSSRVNHGS